jgi:CspA family cold shock protein
MPTGTVTRVFETKGFGYITPDEGDRDVFIHMNASALARFADTNAGCESAPTSLCEGARVQFEIKDSDAGLTAVSVAPLR